MWLKLTFYNGESIRINFNLVEAIQPTDENGANTAISTNNGSYGVRETMEEIEAMWISEMIDKYAPSVAPEYLVKPPKGWK